MRTLYKNARKLYYAFPTAMERIKDEYGNDTLEVNVFYSEPMELKVNYSASLGRESVEIFGSMTDYSRVLVFNEECPLTKGCLLWIGMEPTDPANYKVVRVADSINSTMVAVQELA